MRHAMHNLCWILHKDLLTELRSRGAWSTMVLTGIVVAVIFSVQSEAAAAYKQQTIGSLLWMAVFLAGIPMMDRGFAIERENGCWDGLRQLPVAGRVIFVAKLMANVLALGILECLLIPLFFVLSSVPLPSGAGALVPVALLANIALASVGTTVGCLGVGRRGGAAMVVLVLPLVIPVLLAAAECTRLAVAGNAGEVYWRWVQLLAVFDVLFVAAGLMLFETASEE